ncbi:MAG: PQQ-binding-like beta-propeller repeat protein [Verrucomicrobiales bacterium]|nr:PQQ-binding-like beta-propeller repeat protein [Verrucomicrobiales bacterium]
MNFRLLLLTTLCFLLFGGRALSDHWPEFRGATGQGHAGKSEVPLTWSSTNNVRWKVPVDGKAWSSPIVADGTIFISTAIVSNDQLSLEAHAYSLNDGSQVWKRTIFTKPDEYMHKKNSHASPTPLFENGILYYHFGHHGTAAIDAKTGDTLWKQTSLTYKPVHGTGGSPALWEDRLIFSCDGGNDPFVAALDKSSGKILWKTFREIDVKRPFSFSTPLLIEIDEKPQAIIPGSGAVFSYDPETGKEIWRSRYGEGFSVVPRPLFHNNKIYVCSGFGVAHLYSIRADGEGDVTDSHIEWKVERQIPKESSPIIVDDLLYINDDKGILSCLDPETGKDFYRVRLDGRGGYSSSPVYAGGHLFFHNGDGVTTVVKPGREFEEVAVNEINEFGLSSFAVVSDGFVIRTEENLIRLGK